MIYLDKPPMKQSKLHSCRHSHKNNYQHVITYSLRVEIMIL